MPIDDSTGDDAGRISEDSAGDRPVVQVHPDQLSFGDLASLDEPSTELGSAASPAEPPLFESGSGEPSPDGTAGGAATPVREPINDSQHARPSAPSAVVSADETGRRAWRLVALSDLHLDTPFAWAPEAIGRLRRRDLREALRTTIALAIGSGADALVLPGDIYEHERMNPDTARFLERMLNDAELPVLVAPGNHDPFTPSSIWATASWDEHVHIFDGTELEPFELAPGLTVWGAAHHRLSGTPGFLDNAAISGPGVHVALFHGSESSGFHAEGRDEAGRSKQPHAPFDASRVPEVGLDHAIVGHFHRRREAPHHTYPGNPAALSFGETADGGAVVIDIGEDGRVSRRWHQVSDRAMTDIVVDVTGCGDATAVADATRRSTTGATGLVRITLTGELSPGVVLADDELLSNVDGPDHAVIRRQKLSIAYDLDRVAAERSVRGQFVRAVLDDEALPDDLRRDIITTGLRSLDGRTDLDVAR